MNKYTERILCVDDELSVLNSVKRALRGVCEIEFSDNAETGLEYLKHSGPYAIIVSDMRMPGMDGVGFLEHAKQICPQSTRIMLTGATDQNTAIDALNRGDLFRFLKKPFDNAQLVSVIEAGIRNYRMAIAEKDLLQRTLRGSVQALVDLLSIADPKAFQMSSRLKEIASSLARIQKLEPVWMLDLAVMLAPVGCVALPQEEGDETDDKVAARRVSEAWRISSQIVTKIPRLEKVARIMDLARHNDIASQESDKRIARLAAALKIADAYGRLRRKGRLKDEALKVLASVTGVFEQESIVALSDVDLPEDHMETEKMPVERIEEGMIFADDVFTNDGLLLAPSGLRVSGAILGKMRIFGRERRLPKTLPVLIATAGV